MKKIQVGAAAFSLLKSSAVCYISIADRRFPALQPSFSTEFLTAGVEISWGEF
jgi:hypothetical protein